MFVEVEMYFLMTHFQKVHKIIGYLAQIMSLTFHNLQVLEFTAAKKKKFYFYQLNQDRN